MIQEMADSSRHAHSVNLTNPVDSEVDASGLVHQLVKRPEPPTARPPATIVLVGGLSSVSVPPVRMLESPRFESARKEILKR